MSVRIHLVSYATPLFDRVRGELVESALKAGIDGVFSYSRADLTQHQFYSENRMILDSPCGGGYWAWKPFFILESLRKLPHNDLVLYADAGCRLLSSVEPLKELCINSTSGLVLFDAWPLTNAQFTKRDCFIELGQDRRAVWNANKIIATCLLARHEPQSIDFLSEWLYYCTRPNALIDGPNKYGKSDRPNFIQHRWDQSILSVLAAKYRITSFRNPSKWGNHLKMPEYRIPSEHLSSPYGIGRPIDNYAKAPQFNSPYGTIFEFNRQPNYIGKEPLPAYASAGYLSSVRVLKSRFKTGLRKLLWHE